MSTFDRPILPENNDKLLITASKATTSTVAYNKEMRQIYRRDYATVMQYPPYAVTYINTLHNCI